MKHRVRNFCAAAAGLGAVAILAAQAPPESQQPPAPAAEIGIRTTIRGEPGAPPHYAVPDFVALSTDKETVDAAKLIPQVLWDDLSFEREFDMIPRDTYRTIETIPATDTIATIAGANSAQTASSKAQCGAPATRSRSRCACSTYARGDRPRTRVRQRGAQEPARRRPHHLGRHPSDAGQSPRRRADEADVYFRSGQRTGGRHGRDAQRERGLCRRL